MKCHLLGCMLQRTISEIDICLVLPLEVNSDCTSNNSINKEAYTYVGSNYFVCLILMGPNCYNVAMVNELRS